MALFRFNLNSINKKASLGLNVLIFSLFFICSISLHLTPTRLLSPGKNCRTPHYFTLSCRAGGKFFAVRGASALAWARSSSLRQRRLQTPPAGSLFSSQENGWTAAHQQDKLWLFFSFTLRCLTLHCKADSLDSSRTPHYNRFPLHRAERVNRGSRGGKNTGEVDDCCTDVALIMYCNTFFPSSYPGPTWTSSTLGLC